MFGLFKKQTGDTITFTISGMHCVSCGMNIDGELEEIEGVIASTTQYAQGKTTVRYNAKTTSPKVFRKTIEQLGYTVME